MEVRKGIGGKTVYGARVGILMLDTKWPRPPGDTGNAHTWPFPVLYKVVKGASAKVVIHEKGKGRGEAFLNAASELVKEGADGITTTGGFLAIFQDQLAAHVKVPVASSSLMQIPLVQRYPSHLQRVLQPAHEMLLSTGLLRNVMIRQQQREWFVDYVLAARLG